MKAKTKNNTNVEQRTPLVEKVLGLRHKPIAEYTIEDLRLMIGQNESLDHLVPIALEKLDQNILAEGDFYPGDLLVSLLRIEEDYWNSNKTQKALLEQLLIQKAKVLEENGIEFK